jgi:hypothetical protein
VTSPSWLDPESSARLARALEAVRRGAGEKLLSVSLVGPSVPPARHPGEPVLSLLLVVDDLPVAALSNLAYQVGAALEQGVSIILFTERELLRSADVFTLELAEYRARHLVLLGADPLDQLHFTPAELRSSLERWLRSLSRELRAGVLGGLVEDDGAALERLFADGVDRLAIAAHHLLVLLGDEAPFGDGPLIAALTERAGASPRPLAYWIGKLRAGEPLEPALEALGELLAAIEAATRLVDALGVGAPDGVHG